MNCRHLRSRLREEIDLGDTVCRWSVHRPHTLARTPPTVRDRRSHGPRSPRSTSQTSVPITLARCPEDHAEATPSQRWNTQSPVGAASHQRHQLDCPSSLSSPSARCPARSCAVCQRPTTMSTIRRSLRGAGFLITTATYDVARPRPRSAGPCRRRTSDRRSARRSPTCPTTRWETDYTPKSMECDHYVDAGAPEAQ